MSNVERLGNVFVCIFCFSDLKPENILLTTSGHVKLTDFGLAIELGPADTIAGGLCGTNGYIAPEVLCRKKYGFAVDIFSLGALVHKLLLSSKPSPVCDPLDLGSQCSDQIFSGILPAPANDLLKRLLAYYPSQRLGGFEGDMEEVKRHSFFKGINWEDAALLKLYPPIFSVVRAQGSKFKQESLNAELDALHKTQSTAFQLMYRDSLLDNFSWEYFV